MRNSPTPNFNSLATRKIVLRIIVISSLFSLLVNGILGGQIFLHGRYPPLAEFMGLFIVPVLVLLHHTLRLWPRKKWSVRSEFIYSAIEFIFVTGYLVGEILIITFFAFDSLMMSIFALAFLWLSVGASFVFMIWDLYVSKYLTNESTYDFMDNRCGRNLSVGRWLLLFGENTLKKRFGTDRTSVRGLRAVISILCLLAMITLGQLVLIIQPIQQQVYFRTMPTTPREFREIDTNVTVQVSLAVESWNSEGKPSTGSVDFNITWLPESRHILCYNVDLAGPIAIMCNVPSPFSPSSPDNLIIKINYTRALQEYSTSSLRTGVYLNIDTSGRPEDNGDLTLPIQLYPGFHLFGTTFYSYQGTYASSGDRALGISRFNKHLVTNVQALISDPDFTNSSADTTTATLRLTYQGGLLSVQSNYVLQSEQSSSSVLNGFALIGGIWTFVSGVFTTVFGCSLLSVLFGIKPLSIYGLVHLFQRRRSLVVLEPTLSAEEQRQTVAVLREHFLDDDQGVMEAGEASGEKDQDKEWPVDAGNTLRTERRSRTTAALREHSHDNDDAEANEADEAKNRDEERSQPNAIA